MAPEQKEKKEKKKTVVEAGGDKDPPTTITTGATSAAALTTMNILPDSQQNIKGEEIRKLMGFLESYRPICFNLDLDLTIAEKSNLTCYTVIL